MFFLSQNKIIINHYIFNPHDKIDYRLPYHSCKIIILTPNIQVLILFVKHCKIIYLQHFLFVFYRLGIIYLNLLAELYNIFFGLRFILISNRYEKPKLPPIYLIDIMILLQIKTNA